VSRLHLQIEPEILDPIVLRVVEQTIAALEKDRAALDRRLAFGEGEGARLLSLHAHQLRDERLRGRIKASIGPGRRILYTKQDLLDYLAARRWEGGS
jgi:hypothetical protein